METSSNSKQITSMSQQDSVRDFIQSVGEKLFPGITDAYKTDLKSLFHIGIGYEIQSSLALQISLYFNLFYYPLWFSIMAVSYYLKYDELGGFWRFILATALVSSGLLETGRLLLGYVGNRSEKIPELCSFWMLTLLLQLPIMIFFLLQQSGLPKPYEISATFIVCLFITSQLGTAFFAIRNMARYQTMLLRVTKTS